ncbi:MAG TPA: ABC transporter permease [Streptosporangiaceae bacterium]|nr:ABC transporter permease [Streptosporangiaceae bacterium]
MIQLIAKRAAAAAVIVLVLTAVMFLLQKISPVDPVHAMLGPSASSAAIAAETRRLGLDHPFLDQFVSYLNGLLHGNLGMSYRTRRPVSTDLGSFLPATAELSVYALIFALILAAILAIASTLRWPGASVFRFLLIGGASAPAFLLAIVGILIFYSKLGWLPATGRTSIANAPAGPTGFLTIDGLLHGEPSVTLDALRHLLMPALAIAAVPAVSIGRVLRSSLIGQMGSDYVRTARAKGLTERKVVLGHVLRNSINAALSMTGLQVGLMFSGVVVIEEIFGWPGIGQYMAQSIPAADFPAISGVTLLLGVGYVAVNTIVDILQAVADPRINA